MLNTNIRKMGLCAWFMKHHTMEFFSSLKLQKFLFFYESYSFAMNDDVDMSYLTGYKNGPVFTDVYGYYTYRYSEFKNHLLTIYDETKEKFNALDISIDMDIAKKAAFLVSILSESELSDLSHSFDVWKVKEARIESGEKQVRLNSFDFSENDKVLARNLYDLYSLEQINNWEIISVNNMKFLIDLKQKELLTEELEASLQELSKQELDNPVYISIENGVIVVDD
ncbi:hypothetical protein [Enterococcus faecalis]|uniref:hypothetical protein n=1 Tax=Enterococcus faecalis TaxID=1351 RepID=UPI0019280EDF|nr:hypothetical protein [Enterococcus faecalis]